MKELRPLSPVPIPEVPLPRSPLAQVIAQVRFPSILAVRDPDKMAVFQERLREIYPHLSENQIHSIEMMASQTPNVSRRLIWRLADREQDPRWQVSLGVDFVTLNTSHYDSRRDFLDRLCAVVVAAEEAFKPADAKRFGLRYIDRLTGEAVERIGDLIRHEFLGIMSPVEPQPPALVDSIIHAMTETQFLAQDGNRIQGRWGALPPNATHDPEALEPVAEPSWILDLDMFTSASQPFASDGLMTTATSFAECLYWIFRQMVSEEFLSFYGGESC